MLPEHQMALITSFLCALQAAESPPAAEARAALAAGVADAWGCGGVAGYRMAGVRVTVLAADFELTPTNSGDVNKFSEAQQEHRLHSALMALITSDCTNGPEHLA